MALILTCPHCTTKLKTRQRIACGDPATCPKCNKEFIAADIVEESFRPDLPPELPATDPRSALPVRFEPKSQKIKSAEPDEDQRGRDEDTFPVSYEGSGDNDPSRNRNRVDDDDDKPPSSRSRADDDRSARSRGDDHEPIRYRSRNDAGDRMQVRKRLPARSRRRRRGSNRNVFYFILCFGGALALMGIVLLIVFLMNKGDADEQLLAYLPLDTQTVAGADVDAINKQRNPIRSLDDLDLDKMGIARNDVEKLIFGMSEKDGMMMVFRLKSSFNKARFIDYTRAEERKASGKVYYSLRREPAFAYVDSNSVLVVAEKEDAIKDMLRRDRSKPVLSDSMQELVKSVSSGSFWLASTSTNGHRGFGRPVDFLGDRFETADVRGIAISGKASGDQFETKIVFLTTSSDVATRCLDRMQFEIDQARRRLDDETRGGPRVPDNQDERRSMINSVSVNRSGLLVTLKCKAKNPWGERDSGGAGGNRDLFQLFR